MSCPQDVLSRDVELPVKILLKMNDIRVYFAYILLLLWRTIIHCIIIPFVYSAVNHYLIDAIALGQFFSFLNLYSSSLLHDDVINDP